MKRKSALILICLLLILAMATILVACNDDPVTYKVTFSGEGFESKTVTVEEGKTVTAPSDVKKDGYDLAWQLEGVDFDFSTSIKSDITLTAKWTAKKYTVTLNTNGGTIQNTSVEVTFDNEYNLGVPTKTSNEAFAGWQVDGKYITDSYGDSVNNWSFTENKTATAVWVDYNSSFTYTELQDGTYSISANSGFNYAMFGDTITLPAKYNEKDITVVGSMRYLSVSEVIIPAGVKKIENSAFARNAYLEVVNLANFTGTVGDSAFSNSQIKIVNLGKTTEIGAQAFVDSLVTIIVVPETVTRIGDGAFNDANILEVGFLGEFPALGENVFGNGNRGDDKITLIAKGTAWETLTGMTYDDEHATEFNELITEKTGLSVADMRHYSNEDMTAMSQMVGVLRGNGAEQILVYRGLGMSALVCDSFTVDYVDLYDTTHVYKYQANEITRDTYVFDYENKAVINVKKNAKGESIYDNVLYDYQGSEVVYYVPETVTKVAGGAGMYNENIRFIIMGDAVKEVGSFAFALGNLFSITFGTGIKTIDDYAFFGHDYLQQIIFKGQTPPTIGTAAFCITAGTGGVGPALILSDIAMSSDCFIYADVPEESGWWGPTLKPEEFVEAFNASLEELGELLPSINDEPALYKNANFRKFNTNETNFYYDGNQIETELGIITMMGTDSTGYAIVNYNQANGGNVSYVRYNNIPGYKGNSEPMAIQFMIKGANGFTSQYLYGKFIKGDSTFTFEKRGDEAGSYGEVGKDTLTLDGYGNFAFFGADSSTVDGEYTVNGTEIKLGAFGTVTFNKTEQSVTYKGNKMTLIGEGAGVYYDISNAAKLTVDGKSYKEGDVTYDGKMTIEYNGQITTVGYITIGSTYYVTLNGKSRAWDYSKTSSEYVFQGYFGPGDYDNQLKFKVIESNVIGTFVCEQDTLQLDGYYTAILNTQKGSYTRFGVSDNYLMFIEENVYIININESENKFSYINTVESGKWYTTISSDNAWYFDGNGNYLYYDGSFKNGTYEFNATNGEISIVYDGNTADNNEKGTLDITKGLGGIVYKVGSSNSWYGISRTPITQVGGGFYMFFAGLDGDGKIITNTPWTKVYKVNDTLMVLPSGMPIRIVEPTDGKADISYTISGATVNFELTYNASGNTVSVVTKFDDEKTATYEEDGTTKTCNISWLDSNNVVLWIQESWGISIKASGTVQGGVTTEFEVGDYKVTGYGTPNAVVTKKTTAQG